MKHRRSRATGFTLIELLVVIAIIALLAAILFPVFARARENARRSTCQSNLKQIGLGMLQYTQDYDETYPGVGGTCPSLVGLPQTQATNIMPYVKSDQVFKCPSDTLNSRTVSYGTNQWLGFTQFSLPMLKLSSIQQAPRLITWYEDTYGSSWQSFTCHDYERYFYNYVASTRHLDGTNLAFADGHVKWYKLRQVTASSDAESETQQGMSFLPTYNP